MPICCDVSHISPLAQPGHTLTTLHRWDAPEPTIPPVTLMIFSCSKMEICRVFPIHMATLQILNPIIYMILNPNNMISLPNLSSYNLLHASNRLMVTYRDVSSSRTATKQSPSSQLLWQRKQSCTCGRRKRRRSSLIPNDWMMSAIEVPKDWKNMGIIGITGDTWWFTPYNLRYM